MKYFVSEAYILENLTAKFSAKDLKNGDGCKLKEFKTNEYQSLAESLIGSVCALLDLWYTFSAIIYIVVAVTSDVSLGVGISPCLSYVYYF